jgi:colanic acid/amylovoran biosynthesis protein
MLTIGLLWHSVTSGNLGVGALTFSQIALVEQAAARVGTPVQFRLLGWIPPGERAPIPHVISECGITRSFFVPSKSPFWSHIRACDLVLDIGEGDSFTDIYGMSRFAHFTGTKLLVWLARRPLVLSPQTIGPFDQRLTRMLAKFAMRRCQRVFARDHLSRQYLRDQHIDNADEAIDVAFALPYSRQPLVGNGKTKVGINVSGLLYSGGYTRDNQFGLTIDYAALTHQMLAYFTGRGDCEVYLVSHVITDTEPVEDDYAVCRALSEQYPGTVLAPKFKTPVEAKSFISALEFFVGARMHACIAAFSSGVPVVPLAYSRKFNGLFESLGYRHFGDCKAASEAELMTLVRDSFERRATLQGEVEQGNAQARQRLAHYEDFLTNQLRALNDQKH